MTPSSIILNIATISEDWPMIVAIRDGKQIQHESSGAWHDYDRAIDFSNRCNRRIKPPTPQFRPWTAEEFPPVALYKNGPFIYAPVEYRLGEIVILSTASSGGSSNHCVVNSQSLLNGGWLHSTDGCKTFNPCGVQISGEDKL